MSLEWITPKTDWAISTPFTYVDYNRIRNNLLYLNDKFNEMYPDKSQTLDLGEAKTGYTNEYYPSEFNAFEEALISFERIGHKANIGSRNYYKSNGDFISYNDLNRIESCCLRWNDLRFVDITTFRIEPTSASFDVGDTKTFNVIIEPSNATRKNDWYCRTNSIFEFKKISDTSFTAKNTLALGEVASENYTSKITYNSFTVNYVYRNQLEHNVLYNVGNLNEQGTEILSDNTSLTLKSTGSVIETGKSERPYVYHGFILIGNGIDGNNISTLLTMTTKNRTNDYTWGTDTSTTDYHDDRKAPWRTVFQNVINTEFSNELKQALKSVGKIVHYSATSTGNYSSKYHLLAINEVGYNDEHVLPLGNITYPYLIQNGFMSATTEGGGNRMNGKIDISTRSLWNDTDAELTNAPPDNRLELQLNDTYYNGAPVRTANWGSDGIHKYIEPWENMTINQPLIFLDKSIHVKLFHSTANDVYTIDWTNQSDLTLNDLPLGSIIIDANGTNATLASSVELWLFNHYKIGATSGSAGMISTDINVKVQPSNCSTMDNIVIRTYDENIAYVDNIQIQGNVALFSLHYKNRGTTYLEASLDGKSHTVECITR